MFHVKSIGLSAGPKSGEFRFCFPSSHINIENNGCWGSLPQEPVSNT